MLDLKNGNNNLDTFTTLNHVTLNHIKQEYMLCHVKLESPNL